MNARRLTLVTCVALLTSTCLDSWKLTGPYACSSDGTCAQGLTCDDGVCCKPGGTPACPTLPFEGSCPTGAPKRFYFDSDGDGFGSGQPQQLCARRAGWIAETIVQGKVVLDCDDSDAGVPINPLAPERCNGFDDDCDGDIDEGLPQTPWYRDLDGDGFGSDLPGDALSACGRPAGFAPRAGDCNVMSAAFSPAAKEHCNNLDDNCNGAVDEPPLDDAETPGGSATVACMQDAGICSLGGVQCVRSAVTNMNSLVCVPREVPRLEICDDADNDCNGLKDDAPGCGGPTSFLSTPKVQFGTARAPLVSTAQPSKLPRNCLKNVPGADPQSWFNPSWVGSRAEFDGGIPYRHTWYAEAERGTWWDLSRTSTLRIALTDRSQTMLTYSTANFPGPVVTLCGATDADYLRMSPNTNQLVNGRSLAVSLPLTGAPTGWTVERSTNFSLDRVTRVELTISPDYNGGGIFAVETFIVVVQPTTGFQP